MPDSQQYRVAPSHYDEREHRRMLAQGLNHIIPVLRDFTPALAFGGASTGIAYSARIGRSITMGGVYHEIWLDMDLSSKGSATGNATITGLLEYNRSGVLACSADFSMTNSSGNKSDLKAEILDDSNEIVLYAAHGSTTGSAAALTSSDFTDTSTLHLHLVYRVV